MNRELDVDLWWLSRFADQEVRNTAVNWIETLSDDELTDFLPQFVQVSFFAYTEVWIFLALENPKELILSGRRSAILCL